MTARLRNPLRHQVPAYSPLPLRGVAKAARALVSRNGDPAGALARHLRDRYEAADVRLYGSGTQALAVALALALDEGDPSRPGGRQNPGGASTGAGCVALPAYSCFDVGSAAVATGCPVRFYDLDPRTLGPDPASLRAVLREGARVVVVAPLFGIPVDWSVLDPVLAEAEALVVEDAAQGHGARWGDDPVGAHGALAVLSFGRGKGWTGGGGGALLARRRALADRLRRSAEPNEERRGGDPAVRSGAAAAGSAGGAASLRTVALSGVLWALSRPAVYRVPRALPLLGLGETHYRAPRPVSGIARSSAAFLLASRADADREAEVRGRHAAEYRSALRGRAGKGIAVPSGGSPGFLRFPVLLPGGMDGFRDPVRAQLLGAAPGYPRVLPRLDALSPLVRPGDPGRRWPGAEELVERLVTFPTHSRTRGDERRELVELVARLSGA